MIVNPHRRSEARGPARSRRSAPAAAVLIGVVALTSLAGCGGSDESDRPSVDRLKTQIAKAGGDKVTDDQAECLAKVYYDSGLSDDAVRMLVDAKDATSVKKEDLSQADQKASEKLYQPLTACLKTDK